MIATPTDSELVEAAAATYAANAQPLVSDIDSAIRVFLTTRTDGLNIFAVEGTHNLPGWMLDFLALEVRELPVVRLFCGLGTGAHPLIQHPQLGMIHAGFYLAATKVLPTIREIAAKGPFAVCGHSLGAALALLIGGLLLVDGIVPAKLAAFAPPRVGDAVFVKTVAQVPSPAWRYGDDPVPTVPFTLQPLFPYQQVPLIQFGKPDPVDPFLCHAIGNYVSGVNAAAGAVT